MPVTQAPDADITLASTTETQAELDHATGDNWRDHFDPAKAAAEQGDGKEKKETPAGAPGKAGANKTQSDSGTDTQKKPGAKGESGTETDDDLPKGAKKRIDRLTARLREVEEELAASKQGKGDTTPKKPVNADPEPQQKDFKSYEEFDQAHRRWLVRDENRKQAAVERQRSDQEASKQRYDDHVGRVQSYEAEHPDFRDKVAGISMNFASEQANIAFQLAVVEAENGPAILEHLADHPDEMAKFSELSPVRVQMAVGRISAALSPSSSGTTTTPKPAAQSRTPAPTTQVKRPTTATGTNYLDGETSKKMSDDEWLRAREADVRARKSRR